jgi:ribosomal protein S2
VYGLVDTNSNPKNLTNFVPINDDSSKTIKFVLDLLSEAVLDGQDSARKQGLVQKLDGDKGPKVFSLNATTKKVSVKPVEENIEKEKDPVLSQEPEVQNEQPPKVEEKAEVQETSAKMTKSALAKLTKAQLEEKAKELGITIEGKVLKADLVEQVFKAQ